MHTDTDVFNSRPTRNANQVWRRRRCTECQRVFTTYERVDMTFFKVSSQSYNRARLYRSLLDAFIDHSAQDRYIENCLETIEAKLLRLPQSLVDKADLILIIIKTLQPVDRSAALRYIASHADALNKNQLRTILKY